MSSTNFGPGAVIAAGAFTGATPPVIISQFGYSGVVRNALGVFTVTLTNQCDGAARSAVATPATAGNSVQVGPGTDSTQQFTVTNALGAAVDDAVQFKIVRTA